MTTGADHFNDMLARINHLLEGLSDERRMVATPTLIAMQALAIADDLYSRSDFAAGHDLVAMAAKALREIESSIEATSTDKDRAQQARVMLRLLGADIPLEEPSAVPELRDGATEEEEMAWALAMIEESEEKPTSGNVLVAPVPPTCCFGGCPSKCPEPLDRDIAFLSSDGYSIGTYCKRHADVLLKAIEVWRERNRTGVMTPEEIDALASEG